jgi:hypothetical protein
MQGTSMLKRTSWFVLEVLPYLLSALIAAVVLPGFLYSHQTTAAGTSNVPSLGMIHQDHAVFAPDQMLSERSAKTTGAKVAYR